MEEKINIEIKKERKMNKHIKMIAMQLIFLIAVALVLYLLYPRTNVKLNGNAVSFSSINADVIIISENPDFSNSQYLDLGKGEEIEFSLNPGNYWWKPVNNYIEGLKHELKIESEVGMKIERENESELVNIGNVKINVTKNKAGMMVGHIILEPNESEKIEDKGEYAGRQI